MTLLTTEITNALRRLRIVRIARTIKKTHSPCLMKPPLKEDPYEALARCRKLAAAPLVQRRAASSRNHESPNARAQRAGIRGRSPCTAFFALAFLQYYTLDVMVQIDSLPSIAVFEPTAPGR